MMDSQKLLLDYADRLYGPHHPHRNEVEAEEFNEATEGPAVAGQPPQPLGEEETEVRDPLKVDRVASESPFLSSDGQSIPSVISPPRVCSVPSSVRVLPRCRLSLVSVGGVEGLAFIACNDERIRPAEVVTAILDDLRFNRLPALQSPHLYRVLPILYTASAASLNSLVPSSSLSLLPSSLCSPFTFSVLYRHSNTQGPQIERAEVIRALAERVVQEAGKRQLEGRVKLMGSDLTLLCWIIKSVAFIGVMEKYDDRHHFNVMEVIKERAEPPPPQSPVPSPPSIIARSHSGLDNVK